MKKVFVILSAILVLSGQPVINVKAEDKDLKALAESLGSDTDALKIINYTHDEEHPLYKENFEQYSENCTNVENRTAYMDFVSKISAGMCLGISGVEVLAHNGILTPSDIKSGARNLSDISYDKESDYFITAYSTLQGHFEFDIYRKYLTSMFTYKEQAKMLIDTAEKCMSENRYFLIMYDDLHSFQHAVAGIGIKEGEWQFNGNKYDRCILTLDSNIASKETLLSTPFHEQSCIYINSETLEYYIPVYDIGSGEKGVYLAAIDDDALLSYKCPVSSDKPLDSSYSELNYLRLKYSGYIDYNGNVTEYNGERHEIPKQINELKQALYLDHYIRGKSFEIESRHNEDSGRYHPQIILQNVRSQITASSNYDVRYYSDENSFSMSALSDNETVNYDIMAIYNEGFYSTQPHYNWRILGDTSTNIKLSMKDAGLLLSSDSEINANITITDNDWGADEAKIKEFKIASANDILLKNNEKDTFEFYIDPDNDNIYDKKIEKGDVNCDGVIDGRDATAVLTDYALTSSSKGYLSFVNAELADYDENDVIDGRDATGILSLYAKASIH